MAAFLIVHGLLHPGVWTAPRQPGRPSPFDPWLGVGVLLDVGVIMAVACTWPASVH
ncbi:hypothetical protein [Streptomyces sp. 12257]|uniref:hypothetical protein n=1 Tax=Streptomyces sp. 12257 TaxID=3041009 RepID=UPI000A91BFB1|nr:hypothetical protein [Streptomyces sp. 12257]MDI5905215.1 hypothetical protein [Streptomyces sp. 12257]